MYMVRSILIILFCLEWFSFNLEAQPTIDGETAICEGSTTTLTVLETYAEYMWSTGATTQSITVGVTGTYTVTVTGGGTDSHALDVQALPDVQINSSSTLCTGSSITLSATAGYSSYMWNTEETTPDITITTPGIYSVAIVDNNGCPGNASIEIMEFSNPSPTITGNNMVCVGGTTTIDAGVWSSYSWNNGRDTRELVVSDAGSYSVTITDANGCSGEDTFIIGFFPVPPVDITGNNEICDGQSTVLSVDPGFASYLWNTEETTADITVNATGEYSVSITDGNGCMSEAAISVINPNPKIICPPDTFITITEMSLDTTVNYNLSIILDCGNTFPITQTDMSGLGRGDLFPIGSTLQSFMIVDNNGFQSTCEFTVNVVQQSENVIKFENGDLFLKGIYKGAIYQSPDGKCWKIMVSNDGEIKAFKIKCP
jgi:hypothetical protein